MSKFERARRRARAARSKLPLWARNRLALEGFEIRSGGIGLYWVVAVFPSGSKRDLMDFSWDISPTNIELVIEACHREKQRYLNYFPLVTR